MLDDGYTVDEDGNIKRVNDEGGSEYDVLYHASTYSEENKKNYDDTGDRTGIKIGNDIIKSKKSTKITTKNGDGDLKKEVTNDRYDVKTDEEATKIFEFIEKKTNVEWAHLYLRHPQKPSRNILMTSHERTRVEATYIQNYYFSVGKYYLIRHDHTHPDTHTPSGLKDNSSDMGAKKDILSRPENKNAVFRILFKGKYKEY